MARMEIGKYQKSKVKNAHLTGVFFCLIFVIMATRTQTIRLHQDIKKEFDKLSRIEEFGVQKHSTLWILSAVAQKFYKSPKTVENIVFGRTYIQKQSQQHSLF